MGCRRVVKEVWRSPPGTELGIGLTRQRELMCKGPEAGNVCYSGETMGKPVSLEHRELRRAGER